MAKRGKPGTSPGQGPKHEFATVYSMRDVDRGMAKIGVSLDEERRRKQFHTGSPVDYVFDHKERVPYLIRHDVENAARADLRHDEKVRKSREWTECTPQQAKDAIEGAHERIRGRNTPPHSR